MSPKKITEDQDQAHEGEAQASTESVTPKKKTKSELPFHDHTEPQHRFSVDTRYLVRRRADTYFDDYSEIYVYEVSHSGKALISMAGSTSKFWVDPADYVLVDFLGIGKRGIFGLSFD